MTASECVSLNLPGYYEAQFSSPVLDWVKMDVINLLSKTDGLPDAPVIDENDPTQPASMH